MNEIEERDVKESPWLAEVLAGMRLEGVYAVLRAETTEHGEDRWSAALRLGDATGQLRARAWLEAGWAPQAGQFVRAHGEVEVEGRHLILVVGALEAVFEPTGADLRRLLAVGASPPDVLMGRVEDLVRGLDGPIQRFLAVLLVSEYGLRLKWHPGMGSVREARPGAVLERCWSLLRLARSVCAHYAEAHPGLIRRERVVAGLILRQLAGTFPAAVGGPGTGLVGGHTAVCMRLVDAVCQRLPDDGGRLAAELMRLVLCPSEGANGHAWIDPQMPEVALMRLIERLEGRLSMLARDRGVEGGGDLFTTQLDFSPKGGMAA